MEKKVLLHIGYPKTGTTWFQKRFYPNVENYKYYEREDFNSLFNELLKQKKKI